MDDHQDTIMAVAGRIANQILNSERVKYGSSDNSYYDMEKVFNYRIYQDGDLCDQLQKINLAMALSLNDQVELDRFKKQYEDFILEQVGWFAETVASEVLEYETIDAAHYE